MLKASRLQRSAFDLLPSLLILLGPPEGDVWRRDVLQSLVEPRVIVVVDNPGDFRLQVPRKGAVLKGHKALNRCRRKDQEKREAAKKGVPLVI